jgi:hypothetical protein
MRRYYVLPAVPAIALVLMPFLPFVNAPGLWFGLPRMLVWATCWVLLFTPAFLVVERFLPRDEPDPDERGGANR